MIFPSSAEREKEVIAVVDNRSCRVCQNGESANRQGGVRRENNCNSGERGALMKKLQMIDFAITETVLYLDAYPDSKPALAYYHKLVSERERLSESLARNGKPITYMNNADTESWNWTNGPWPWELDAN